MSYSIRRWMSTGGMQFDDSETAKTAEDAARKAEMLAGIFHSCINEDVRKQIQELEPGDVLSIRKSSLHFSLRIRRNKR